jgi:hypothetical protein
MGACAPAIRGRGLKLLAQCNRIKADGTRCKAVAMDSSGLCYSHSPTTANKRQRNARKGGRTGGRGRGKGDIKEVKAWLLSLAQDVQEGRLEAKDGTAVSQILNIWLRGVEMERKLKEQEELAERLEALESVLRDRKKVG